MSSRIIYDRIWFRGYIARLYEERAAINQTIHSLNVAKHGADIEQTPVILAAQSELEDIKREISSAIDALENYQYSADHAARVLQQSVHEIDFPSLLK